MQPQIQHIVNKKEEVVQQLLALPGVTGVDVGYKYVGGKKTDEIAIRVHVAQKKKTVAAKDKVPDKIQGIKTDVIERVYYPQVIARKLEEVTLEADTNHYNPVKGGISIGPDRSVGGYVYAGTLGVMMKDNLTSNPVMLSNFHVMCIDNSWNIGDDINQPSLIDTGTHADKVGKIVRAVLSTHVDGAISSLSGRGYACDIVDIGTPTGTAAAVLNAPVRKRGRTTLLTYGFVESISGTVNVDYGDGIGVKTLSNQIGIRPDTSHNPKFSDHGDSGSVVVDNELKIIGLLFAGSDDGHAFINPINSVLSELNVSMCTPTKSVIKDLSDSKHFHKDKIEVKEHKNEVKEHKNEKLETKELKDRIKDIKEVKLEKNEIFEGGNKPVFEHDPKISEGGGGINPTSPSLPGGSLNQDIMQRLSQLESVVGQLSTFISSELRPDLSQGALRKEGDISQGDMNQVKNQLQQNLNSAIQAKTEFDNNCQC